MGWTGVCIERCLDTALLVVCWSKTSEASKEYLEMLIAKETPGRTPRQSSRHIPMVLKDCTMQQYIAITVHCQGPRDIVMVNNANTGVKAGIL